MKNEIFISLGSDGSVSAFYQTAAGSIIPGNAVKITRQQFYALYNNQGKRKFVDGCVVAYEPPAPEPVIPDRLSRRQFGLALIDAGLIEQVEGWIATQDIRTQAAYADSGTFLRTDEMLQQGFTALGFTIQEVSNFFRNAAQI